MTKSRGIRTNRNVFPHPIDNETAIRQMRLDSSVTNDDLIKWRNHRAQAYRRNIPFNMSLLDWVYWWRSEIAKLGPNVKRGAKGNQYVMARIGDKGAYEIGNVKCITRAENAREGARHAHKVLTPLGCFPSEIAAARAHGFKFGITVYRQIKQNKPGWAYVFTT